jgi:hypothetical protein
VFFENPSITKTDKGRMIMNHTIFDVPGAAIKTFLPEGQSKWLIAVINPVAEDGYCMLARVCTVPDYTKNKHVVVHVILPV